jgi:hypothetical protein
MTPSNVPLPPQATAQPIFPLGDEPRNRPVKLRGRPGYRFLDAYVVPPVLHGAAEGVNLHDGAMEILTRYFPFLTVKGHPPLTVPNPHGYPIGTLLPVNIAGKDYLFLFDWHFHQPGGPSSPTAGTPASWRSVRKRRNCSGAGG